MLTPRIHVSNNLRNPTKSNVKKSHKKPRYTFFQTTTNIYIYSHTYVLLILFLFYCIYYSLNIKENIYYCKRFFFNIIRATLEIKIKLKVVPLFYQKVESI